MKSLPSIITKSTVDHNRNYVIFDEILITLGERRWAGGRSFQVEFFNLPAIPWYLIQTYQFHSPTPSQILQKTAGENYEMKKP